MNFSNSDQNLGQKLDVVNSMSDGNSEFQILEINKLEGSMSVSQASDLQLAEQKGLKARYVRIIMSNSVIKTEAGALYYYIGNIESQTKVGGVGGFLKKSIAGGLTDEKALKPMYGGTGEVWLEPSFKHYILLELKNEEIIVDKGMFYCCSGGVDVRTVSQKNISSALLGGEGIFQIGLSGTGVVVLESLVPQNEIIRYDINQGQVIKVDGNFAIARTAGIQFSVTKSDKGLFASAMNGEGLLNTFTGQGSVWLAPTIPVYSRINMGLAGMLNNASSNNK